MILQQAFKKAIEDNYALGAFNVSTLVQVKAVLGAAVEMNVPVILELSPGEADFLGIEVLAGIRNSISKEIATFTSRQKERALTAVPLQGSTTWGTPVPVHGSEGAALEEEKRRPAIFLNLDHAKDIVTIQRALEAGFDMVHFDGSELPFEKNITRTKEVVKLAKDYGALVEGEIDRAGGHSTKKERVGKRVLTDPGKAAEFVSKTGVDILACFFGNLHGVYSKELELDFDHFQKIVDEVTRFNSNDGVASFSSRGEAGQGPAATEDVAAPHLPRGKALRGGVPKNVAAPPWGARKERALTAVPLRGSTTWGTPVPVHGSEDATPGEGEVFFSLHGGSGVRAGDLSQAAQNGIVKMNFNTELRQAWAGSLRESLAKNENEIVPYKILPPVVEAVQGVVETKISLLMTE